MSVIFPPTILGPEMAAPILIMWACYTMENGPNDKNGEKMGKSWKICPDRKWEKNGRKIPKKWKVRPIFHFFGIFRPFFPIFDRGKFSTIFPFFPHCVAGPHDCNFRHFGVLSAAKPALKTPEPALKWAKPALKRPNRHFRLQKEKKSKKIKIGTYQGTRRGPWGSNFDPHPQTQISLVRISVWNQVSDGNSY